MFETMRKVFGPVAVAVIIGAIALVFVFYGVFNPKGSAGLAKGTVAAEVNGEYIPFPEFEKEYQQRVEFYAQMFKGKADPNMLQQLGLRQQVLQDMVTRKLIVQEARRMGVAISDEEVRDKIFELPYFKKDGRFSPEMYKAFLQSNRRAATEFEVSVREDLARNRFMDFLKSMVQVSDAEIRSEFLSSEDRRKVDYVWIDREAVRKKLGAILKDDKKGDELTKMTKAMADEVLAKSKGSNSAQMKAFAKSKGLELKTSDKFSAAQMGIPMIGEVPQLMSDAFVDNSPLAKGAKLYETRSGFVVAMNLQSFKPDMNEMAKKRDALVQTIESRKEQEMFREWMKTAREGAKIHVSKALTQPGTAGGFDGGMAGGEPIED